MPEMEWMRPNVDIYKEVLMFYQSYVAYDYTTRKHAYNEEKLRGNIFLVNLRENYYDFTTKLNFVVKS